MKNLSTVKNLGKTAKVSGPKVVQIRGKGFDAGGSNPRASNNVRPIPAAKMPSDPAAGGSPASYLPQQQFSQGGKVQAMKYGKGSKMISCTYK